MYHSLSKRKILAVCIAASLISHIISLVFLQKHSFWSSPSKPAQGEMPSLSLMAKVESDKILRESFQENSLETDPGSAAEQKPHPETTSAPSLPLVIQPIHIPPLFISSSVASIALKHEFEKEIQIPSFTLPPIESLNLFEHLPKDLIIPAPSLAKTLQSSPSFLPKAPMALAAAPDSRRASPLPITYPTPLLTPSLHESGAVPQSLKPQILSHLPDFPTLEELGGSSYSDFFDTEIVFSPMDNGKGYVFALTLVPQPGLTLPKIRQHYTFLIDRSNSIQKERLTAVKNAVLLALQELDLEDSFNIIAFDSKVEKLSPAPLPATSTSLHTARNFLNQIHLGSFFSTTNICKPLLLTVPGASQDEGLHTAILFSDGEPLSKKAAQRELALEWTAYNQGRVSFFAISLGNDPHLATLETTAALNRGKLLHSPTKRGIKRKLLKLVKTIAHPIAKNLTATAIPRSSQTNIFLYPKTQEMPSLYLNQPYVILGTIDKLDNFIFFIQGKLKNKWLNIRKNISFINAKRGDASLKAEWALQQAYTLYEKYLSDLDPAHLAEAKALLEPHNLQSAFQ